MAEITEADWLEGRDNWRERHGREVETDDCPDCNGQGVVQGEDRLLLCSRCSATGEILAGPECGLCGVGGCVYLAGHHPTAVHSWAPGAQRPCRQSNDTTKGQAHHETL